MFESKRRYGLTILNYVVTSNHIHLLVVDGGERETIPKSIQLTAGRCAQEYNLRKKRKGAYWEDRCHAAGIESGKHFLNCLVYIDLNMVLIAKLCGHKFSDYFDRIEQQRIFHESQFRL